MISESECIDYVWEKKCDGCNVNFSPFFMNCMFVKLSGYLRYLKNKNTIIEINKANFTNQLHLSVSRAFDIFLIFFGIKESVDIRI